MRLLALRPGALGDLILSFPLLHGLGRQRPAWRFELAGNARFVELARYLPGVEKVHDFGSRLFTGLFSEEEALQSDLTEFLSRFDAALILANDEGRLLRRRLEAAGISRVLDLPASSQASAAMHRARLLGSLARELGLDEPDCRAATLEGAFEGERRELDRPLALLHPGAGSIAKRWPADRFAAITKALLARDWVVRLLEGEADSGCAEAVRQVTGEYPLLETFRPAGVLELAATLASGSLFVGNDSGPAHLAAALGIPVIAIFGPTDPALWAPCGPAVTVVRRPEGLGWPSVEEVLAVGRGAGS